MPVLSTQALFCFYINQNFHTHLFIQRLTEIHSQLSKEVTSEFNISVLCITWHFSPWCDSSVTLKTNKQTKTLILKFLP